MKLNVSIKNRQEKRTMAAIADEMNRLVMSDGVRFFVPHINEIHFEGFSNMDYHNKLMALVTLFLCSLRDIDSFVSHNWFDAAPKSFMGRIFLSPTGAAALWSFLRRIEKLEDININIDYE